MVTIQGMSFAALAPTLIFLAGVITNINPNLGVGKSPAIYVLLFSGFFLFLLRLIQFKKSNKISLNAAILVIAMIPSVVFSEYWDVAILKLLIFFVCLLGLIELVRLSSSNDILLEQSKSYLKSAIYLTYTISMLIWFAGLGYTVNDTGFSGILGHPQAFSLLTVLCFLFLFTESYDKNIKKAGLIFVIGLLIIVATESRAGAISYISSLLYYVMVIKKSGNKKINVKEVIKRLVIILLSVFFVINFGHQVITKSGRSDANNAIEALEKSRLRFAISSIENFLENPVFGIGFQVSNGHGAHYKMEVIRGPLNIPIKASIEKGSFPPALLEEVGFVGALFFVAFLFSLYFSSTLGKGKVILIAVVLMSLGESVLFSLGGVGVFCWLFIFFIFFNSEKKGFA